MTPRSLGWMLGLAVITAAIVVPIGYLGTVGLLNESKLAGSGRTTCARITERQVVQGRSIEYQVKYRFLIGETHYQAQDETGRNDLWVPVPAKEWNRSLATGCVEVLYLPDDPHVNRPVAAPATGPPVGNKVAALVLCTMTLGFFAAAAAGIVGVARTRVWQLVAAENDGWVLSSDDGQMRIRAGDVLRAKLIPLPKAALHPPWRFGSDVVKLSMKHGGTVVVALRGGSPGSPLLQELQRTGVLRNA